MHSNQPLHLVARSKTLEIFVGVQRSCWARNSQQTSSWIVIAVCFGSQEIRWTGIRCQTSWNLVGRNLARKSSDEVSCAILGDHRPVLTPIGLDHIDPQHMDCGLTTDQAGSLSVVVGQRRSQRIGLRCLIQAISR